MKKGDALAFYLMLQLLGGVDARHPLGKKHLKENSEKRKLLHKGLKGRRSSAAFYVLHSGWFL